MTIINGFPGPKAPIVGPTGNMDPIYYRYFLTQQSVFLIPANNLSDVSSVAASQTNLNVPDRIGTNASGNWNINILGNAATATTAAACSGNAATATTASTCTGNSATVTTNANLTGDVTSVGNASTVAKIAGVAVGTPTGTGNVVMSSNVVATSGVSSSCTGNAATATTATNISGIATVAHGGTGVSACSAISIYMSANQSIPSATNTKLKFDTKIFDLNSDFDATTNYRWTPTIAGKYFINGYVTFNAPVATGYIDIALYKNGSVTNINYFNLPVNSDFASVFISGALAMNGSTDYLELYFFHSFTGSQNTNTTTASLSSFSGFRIAGS